MGKAGNFQILSVYRINVIKALLQTPKLMGRAVGRNGVSRLKGSAAAPVVKYSVENDERFRLACNLL